MNSTEMVFNLRKRIFEEWRYKRYTWQEVHEKYGFSKKWFYKWLKRYLKYGDDGLRDKARSPRVHPASLHRDEKEKILEYVYNNPTHGPRRISDNLSFKISGKTIWKFLKKENLNTRRRRRLWAESRGKPVLTQKEKRSYAARKRHIGSSSPGELVGVDTFWLNIKTIGKVFQWTACCNFSSYGWAKVYYDKTADQTIDFLENHILRRVPAGKIKRILTDQGTEFYSARHNRYLIDLERIYAEYDLAHTVTKPAHPWTNGYAERLNQTIWQDFYLCRLNKPYRSIDELNVDLQKFMTEYNWRRKHTGYKLAEGGYQFPGHAFFDIKERENIVEAALPIG